MVATAASQTTPVIRRKSDWAELADSAAGVGQFTRARILYEHAIDADRRNATLRFKYAMVLEELGELGDAAIKYTELMRVAPNHRDGARNLSQLLSRCRLDEPGRLDADGLQAALRIPRIDLQPIVDVALAHAASDGRISGILLALDEANDVDVARMLIGKRTHASLIDELMLIALQRGVVTDHRIERLLTAVRQVVACELPDERFVDRGLDALLEAMLAQLMVNDHAFLVSAKERAAVEANQPNVHVALKGDVSAGLDVLKAALYRPLEDVLAGVSARDVSKLRPRWLAVVAKSRLESIAGERRVAQGLDTVAPVTRAISRDVASHRDSFVVPRWLETELPAVGSGLQRLSGLVAASSVSFQDRAPDVLVVGTGTGRDAVDAAVRYGRDTSVLAVDISRARLAYGARMAKRLSLKSLRFAEADLLDLPNVADLPSFDIIEAMGVLHELEEPAEGVQALSEVLAPGGIMRVGIMSALSRQPFLDLDFDEDHPGVDGDDDAVRRYRSALMTRDLPIPGGSMLRSRSMHNLNEFRDLVLPPCDRPMTLPEIAKALDAAGLRFLAFETTPLMRHLVGDALPKGKGATSLDAWWDLEQATPGLFNGMYRFWCQKRGT